MQNVWFVAAAWMGLAFVASVISIRIGVSVALLEIAAGVIAGNFLGFQPTEWINFLATFGAGLLTFLAGAEIDPESLYAHWRASVSIGVVSFLVPFLSAWAFAYWISSWDYHAALIAGIALSTTSVAVVYAVMVESGFSSTDLGKLILAACFVTDFGTVLALGAFFADFNRWMLVFIAVLAVMLWYLPRWTKAIISSFGQSRVSEPEVKFLFLVLFFLGGLATTAKSEAVPSGLSRWTSCRRCLLTGQSSGKPDARDRVYDAYSFLFHQGWTLRLLCLRYLPVPASSSCF